MSSALSTLASSPDHMPLRSSSCRLALRVSLRGRGPLLSIRHYTPAAWPRPNGGAAYGYAHGPLGAPGVVVLQEWWGITEQIQTQAEKIAANGYRALVPDLYDGRRGVDAEEASHLMNSLNFERAVEDIAGAARRLKSEGSAKVGVIGFCMGGALSIASTVLVDDIAAGIAFYGTPQDDLADVTKLKKPLQAHFGENDSLVGLSDPAAADALEKKLKKSGAPYELYRYPGVGHGFMNDLPEFIVKRRALGFGEHDQKAVDLAWSRVFAYLDKTLRK